jgi:hypothetical protein
MGKGERLRPLEVSIHDNRDGIPIQGNLVRNRTGVFSLDADSNSQFISILRVRCEAEGVTSLIATENLPLHLTLFYIFYKGSVTILVHGFLQLTGVNTSVDTVYTIIQRYLSTQKQRHA